MLSNKEEQSPTRPKQTYSSVFFEPHLDLARRGFVLPLFDPSLNCYHRLELAIPSILTQLASLPSFLNQPSCCSHKTSSFIPFSFEDSTLNIWLWQQLSTSKYFWPSSITSFSSTLIAHLNVITSSSSAQDDQKEATISMRYSVPTMARSNTGLCLSSTKTFLPASLHWTYNTSDSMLTIYQCTTYCSANSSTNTKSAAARILATQTEWPGPTIYTIWKAQNWKDVPQAFMDGEQWDTTSQIWPSVSNLHCNIQVKRFPQLHQGYLQSHNCQSWEGSPEYSTTVCHHSSALV